MLKFPEEFEKYIKEDSDFNRSFNIKSAVENYDNIIHEIESTYE